MKESRIIELSTSKWASPIVVVKKKNGNIQLCVDFQRLNAVTPMDAYPMPWVDELLDRLGKARFITTIDQLEDTGKSQWQRRTDICHPR